MDNVIDFGERKLLKIYDLLISQGYDDYSVVKVINSLREELTDIEVYDEILRLNYEGLL